MCYINIIFNLSHFIAAAEEPAKRTSAGFFPPRKKLKVLNGLRD
jgi:hypothetical protein